MKIWHLALIVGALFLTMPFAEYAHAVEQTNSIKKATIPVQDNAAAELAEEQRSFYKRIQWMASKNPIVGPKGDVAIRLVGGADDSGFSWSYDKNELRGIVSEFTEWGDDDNCRFFGAGKGDTVTRLEGGGYGRGKFLCCQAAREGRPSLCYPCGLRCLAGGSYGVAFFEFQGIKKGSVKIHFIYKRLWEKNEPPLKTADYVLTVDGKGHLSASKQ